jgi:hypothetical protein
MINRKYIKWFLFHLLLFVLILIVGCGSLEVSGLDDLILYKKDIMRVLKL